jgi:hypothetical protein
MHPEASDEEAPPETTHASGSGGPSVRSRYRCQWSIYLQGIDTEEIIATAHARRPPMMSATAGLQL